MNHTTTFVGVPLSIDSSSLISSEKKCAIRVGHTEFLISTSLLKARRIRRHHDDQLLASAQQVAATTEDQDMDHKSPDDGKFIPQRLSLGERARTVVHVCREGTLCTTSSKHPGNPFGSHVDYIIDEQGRPIFLLAQNAAHTGNLRQDSRCSLFAQPITRNNTTTTTMSKAKASSPSSSSSSSASGSGKQGQGQGGTRTTLIGKVQPLPEELIQEYEDVYVFNHPHAADALKYKDKFNFFRMDIEDVYYVGGFGVSATYVDVDEYSKASPDPLAHDVPQIIDTMNANKANLELLTRVFLGLDSVLSVKMVAIDRFGFDLRVKKSNEVTSEYRIGFREGLVSNVFDAHSSLTKVVQEAWERENGHEDIWVDEPPRPVIMYYDGSQRN